MRLTHRSKTLRNCLGRTPLHKEPCKLQNCPLQAPKLCDVKGCVYKVCCNTCHQVYIGSTKRALHIRIREHLQSPSSSVYQHLHRHSNTNDTNNSSKSKQIKTIIIDKEQDPINLRFLESLYIKKLKPEINSRQELSSFDPLIIV